jgi:nitroreductase
MEQENERWYAAIETRMSRRSYDSTAVETEKMQRLSSLAGELSRRCGGGRAVVAHRNASAVFSGLRGGYGVIRGAPAYIAFVADTGDSAAFEKLGYIGEGLILEATALGLGTCWVSGTFDKSAAAGDAAVGPSEHLFAVSPLGYPRQKKAMSEKVMSGIAGSRKRKPLAEITSGPEWERWPQWTKTAVEAARLAPSALNRQPWLFHFSGEELTVYIAGSRGTAYGRAAEDPGKRLDCGIALRHLTLGAGHLLGRDVSPHFLPPPEVGSVCPD